MGYKVKNGKGKKKSLKFIIVIITIIAIVMIILKFASDFKTINMAYEIQKLELGDLKTKTERMGYITNREIKAGEVISLEDVVYDTCYSSMDISLFANVIQEGTLALIDMKEGTQVLTNMISDESVDSNIREEEFNVIHLSSNLVSDDYVDIRILYPNGENYIVLSKKILKSVNLSSMNCFMWLDESEILLMSSAIVDAYLTPGTTLYTTKYIASSVQEASEVNFIPSKQIINMIKENPNIIEMAKRELSVRARTAQENRIEKFVQKYYSASEDEDKKNIKDNDEFEAYLYGKNKQPVVSDSKDDVDEKEDLKSPSTIDDIQKEGDISYVD